MLNTTTNEHINHWIGWERACFFAWKLKQSSKLDKLFIAPGNAGTAALGQNLAIDTTDFSTIRGAVLENRIQMVAVGPEIPLVAGIHDFFLRMRN